MASSDENQSTDTKAEAHTTNKKPATEDTAARKLTHREKAKLKGKKKKVLEVDDLQEFNESVAKRGVVYMSRVPPFMSPLKLRHLLVPYANVLRIYLTPEDTSQRKKRRRTGGNKKQCFQDGWVEFEDKKEAKRLARSLNNTPIGGKAKFWREDLWNLKYLPGFKWHNLTEKIAYDKAVREQRLRFEMSQMKKQDDGYLERVAKARMHSAIEERKKKKGTYKEAAAGEADHHMVRQRPVPSSVGSNKPTMDQEFLSTLAPAKTIKKKQQQTAMTPTHKSAKVHSTRA
mmetsp:Transcript_25347/g.63582  ORF Transcript_25347/g.63582 Transcript_25347/m.63582 type:complete len:287 (+) Transcript_25347:109-969(+)|eukprot:CAMPEP_0177648938 /NCGR_PEP_ID=MMETSP0447-20121125/11099_1 /TAXON_ID=0 /ORGANISM="Stygamoeba regulata, Strain BSH-02190019" /LENGTH=286 /DNA_ID=CAMNT_0019151621 /DNA_START=135 /DNA_END=995 /DNA_ORIENTATION=+